MHMIHYLKNSILYLLLLIPSALWAIQKDSIYVDQFVKDSFTQYGIRNAKVTIMDMEGHIIDTVRTQAANGSHDAQAWFLTVPRQPAMFRVRVEQAEYEPGEMVVELKHPARLNSFRFPDFLLKRKFEDDNNVYLNEVAVHATRVKLCYKGDTIEVDARAFKLSEGSMLESLVRNVPGCELHDNGDIYMNGRKVDFLTLNGKDFFKGNNRIMLDNLPYYTVDKLQFFNQRSELSRLMGKDVERPDFVMNVKMKQEYNIGYLGNIEAGAGTHDRRMGRMFALRFTDNSRVSLFANANNINEARSPGNDGSWGHQDNPAGYIKTYNIGGEWLIDDKYGRYKELLNTSMLWNKTLNKQHTASQQFIQQGDVFGYGDDESTRRGYELKINNNLTLKKIDLVSTSRFNYIYHDNDSHTRSAQFSQQPSGGVEQCLDSIFSTTQSSEIYRIMVNHMLNEAANSGNRWTAEQKFDYHKTLPWGDDLMLTANGSWNGASDDGTNNYKLKYNNVELLDDNQNRQTEEFSQSYQFHFGVNYAYHFLSEWHLNLGLGHDKQHSNERRDLFRLYESDDSLHNEALPSLTDYLRLCDAGNSPHSRNTRREEQFIVSLHRHLYDSRRGRYLSFTSQMSASYVWQQGVYSRGENIARLSDHRWLFAPSVNLEYQTRQWHDSYVFHYDTEMNSINLVQKANLTDTSDPLAVQKGNPNLRPSQKHNLSLSFSSRFGTHGQFVMVRSSASIMSDLVAMNSNYNKTTGVYTYIPANINGNWYFSSSIDLRRALTENRCLNIENHTSYDYQHSVDYKDNVKNSVPQYTIGDNLKLEYKQEAFVLELLGGCSWNEVRPVAADNIHSIHFNYGANLRTNLPWGFHLSTDIKMYSRRGYIDKSLCTNDLLWNAQMEHSFCSDHLLVTAKAFDLLHQISTIHTTINAQARIETWQLSLPSYLMLSVQWKFNKNPKKRDARKK